MGDLRPCMGQPESCPGCSGCGPGAWRRHPAPAGCAGSALARAAELLGRTEGPCAVRAPGAWASGGRRGRAPGKTWGFQLPLPRAAAHRLWWRIGPLPTGAKRASQNSCRSRWHCTSNLTGRHERGQRDRLRLSPARPGAVVEPLGPQVLLEVLEGGLRRQAGVPLREAADAVPVRPRGVAVALVSRHRRVAGRRHCRRRGRRRGRRGGRRRGRRRGWRRGRPGSRR
mmetsp:Transcript_67980/g.189570  ORF Transcript_67980/g.189570 Transcript_67980/m.189570 type:complete len:227 (+) Transcript_67980:71-751(+)